MINVVTVHWQSPKWIGVQLDYLDRCIGAPYRVYAALNGIEDKDLWSRFHYAEDMPGSHPEKLNALAKVVALESDPSDVIIFLDGDAFPVQALFPRLHDEISKHSLVAVQRREILDDRRPHPCFCATTVGFWSEIGGDWRWAPWRDPNGRFHNDVGSRLMLQLEQRGTEWLAMNRSNTNNIHPVWFAVYGHRVYHHGAGFRPMISRVDINKAYSGAWKPMRQKSLGALVMTVVRNPSIVLKVRRRHLDTVKAAMDKTVVQARTRYSKWRSERQSNHIFSEIVTDPSFYRRLDERAGA